MDNVINNVINNMYDLRRYFNVSIEEFEAFWYSLTIAEKYYYRFVDLETGILRTYRHTIV